MQITIHSPAGSRIPEGLLAFSSMKQPQPVLPTVAYLDIEIECCCVEML